MKEKKKIKKNVLVAEYAENSQTTQFGLVIISDQSCFEVCDAFKTSTAKVLENLGL